MKVVQVALALRLTGMALCLVAMAVAVFSNGNSPLLNADHPLFTAVHELEISEMARMSSEVDTLAQDVCNIDSREYFVRRMTQAYWTNEQLLEKRRAELKNLRIAGANEQVKELVKRVHSIQLPTILTCERWKFEQHQLAPNRQL